MTAITALLQSGEDLHATEQCDDATLNARLASVFAIQEHQDAERGEIEAFIRQCFAAAHGAHIAHFMPRLLSLRSHAGELIAAFGLRAAVDTPLFLESYLDRPIESILQSQLGCAVRREEIVEVGNLSVLYPGAARWLIVALTARLRQEGYRWVTFTGTAALRNGFHRLGLRPVELGAASLSRLPQEDRASWGTYYDNSPLVLAGDIAYGYQALLMRRNLPELLRAGMGTIEGRQQQA